MTEKELELIKQFVQTQAGITRSILVPGFVIIFLLLAVITIIVLSNRKDRTNWKIWKDASAEYLEHMHIVAMAKNYADASINVSAEGYIKFVSDRMEEFTGWKRKELRGETLATIFSPDNIHKIEGFRKEHGDRKDRTTVEAEIVLKNGKVVPVDVSLADFEHEGSSYTTMTFRDITHRKGNDATKRILQELALRMTKLLELEESILHAGAWSWDLPNDLVEYSPGMGKMFSLRGEHVTGNDLMEKVFIDDRPNVNVVMGEGIAKCIHYEMSYRLVHPNGKKDLVLCVGNPICNENGKTIKVNGIVKILEENVD